MLKSAQTNKFGRSDTAEETRVFLVKIGLIDLAKLSTEFTQRACKLGLLMPSQCSAFFLPDQTKEPSFCTNCGYYQVSVVVSVKCLKASCLVTSL